MYLKIKVVPDSKKEVYEKIKDDEYRICVTVPAKNNAANTRVVAILHDIFPNKSIRIITGHHSPSKIVSIN